MGGPLAADCYFVVPLGLVGLLGLVVLLPLEPGKLLLPLDAPPLLLPLEELDLLKYASHSERDTCPSLFVSTAEKVGVMLLDELLPPRELPPLEALPPLDIPEDPDEPEAPVALGDVSVLELEDELCAIDTPAIAKRAAAVAVPTIFNIWKFLLYERLRVGTAPGRGARSMPGTTPPSVGRRCIPSALALRRKYPALQTPAVIVAWRGEVHGGQRSG